MSDVEKSPLDDVEVAEVQGGVVDRRVPPRWVPYTDPNRSFYCPNCDRNDLEYDARNAEPNYFRCKHCNHRFYKKESHGYSVGSGW